MSNSSNPYGSGGGLGGSLNLPKISGPEWMAALVVTALLILLIMVIRYAIRRLGGRRRAWRRLRRELVLTGRAFSEPVRTFQRHQREVRVLTEHLCDPRAHLFVRRALSAVELALTGAPGAHCYAVRVGPYGGEAQLASRRPVTAPEPWQADEDNPLSWYIDPEQWDTLPTADGPTGRRPLPVTVGITYEEEDCVVLDLAAGPRMICVEGDGAGALRLLYCLAAQLDSPAGGARVVLTGGVHSELSGPHLTTLLDELEEESEPAEPGSAGELVVVCSSPTHEQERRLRALARSGRILCLVHGRLAGHCWALRVDSRGRVIAAELGLDADSAGLPRAVARSIREGARLTAREARAVKRRAVQAAGNDRPPGGGDGRPGRHARAVATTARRHSAATTAKTATTATTATTAGRRTADQDTTALLPPVVPAEPTVPAKTSVPAEPTVPAETSVPAEPLGTGSDSLAEPAPSEQLVKGASSASH